VDQEVEQVLLQHNGATGSVPKITAISKFTTIERENVYYGGSLKDMVVVLPGDPDAQIGRGTIIRTVPFPKTGRYNYHCHILSHEVRDSCGQVISDCFRIVVS
jgi:FtsP/CotA-like multicopper oxidase with cupredoxin domain